ncbi:MAG TPA: NAD-dependent epimerase/dehydratase family protein [Candidatus Methylomirabilis sp.]|nr:NAD-dependent epimerase/dehydratase family protein [Candidatus Methylomirabilis sp.]
MSAFAEKNILVTGGEGFLGGPLIRILVERGARPENIKVPSFPRYDFRLPEACAEAVTGQDIVIHLAANAGGIGWNRAHPGALFYDNAAMGIHLMEESRKAGVSKFVQIGTVCAYPFQPPRIPFREDDLWAGYPERTNAPYGIAKKAMLVMGQAYRQEYDFNVIYLLPVNLYGPGDHFFEPEKSHVIPALIQKFVDARETGASEVVVWGTGYFKGTPVSREFLYVDDAAEAIALAAERYDGAEPVNIGAGFEVAINDLIAMVCEMTGYGGKVVRDLSKPDGQPRRCLDTSRAKATFGFIARTPFEDGLRKTIAWYEQARYARRHP